MKLLSRTAMAFKDAVFPSKCLVCRSFFHRPSSWQENVKSEKQDAEHFVFFRFMYDFLCPVCLADFLPVEPPGCPVCGKIFRTGEGDDHECEECIMAPKYFSIARAAGVYDQSLMVLIHQFKYKGKIQLAGPLGRFLFFTMVYIWGNPGANIIIPVPLHRLRFKKRGFNQAYLLVKEWNRINEMFHAGCPSIRIEKDALVRKKSTKPQTGLSRKEREKNMRSAFRVTDPAKITGKRILLVDDVYTTGATTNECARILLKCGAEKVDVLTLARAM